MLSEMPHCIGLLVASHLPGAEVLGLSRGDQPQAKIGKVEKKIKQTYQKNWKNDEILIFSMFSMFSLFSQFLPVAGRPGLILGQYEAHRCDVEFLRETSLHLLDVSPHPILPAELPGVWEMIGPLKRMQALESLWLWNAAPVQNPLFRVEFRSPQTAVLHLIVS